MLKKNPSPKETKDASSKVSTTGQSKRRLIKKNTEKVLSSEMSTNAHSGYAERSVETVSSPPEALQPRVAIRAYELYQRRGGHHGQDLDDWFQAERQVLSEELSN